MKSRLFVSIFLFLATSYAQDICEDAFDERLPLSNLIRPQTARLAETGPRCFSDLPPEILTLIAEYLVHPADFMSFKYTSRLTLQALYLPITYQRFIYPNVIYLGCQDIKNKFPAPWRDKIIETIENNPALCTNVLVYFTYQYSDCLYRLEKTITFLQKNNSSHIEKYPLQTFAILSYFSHLFYGYGTKEIEMSPQLWDELTSSLFSRTPYEIQLIAEIISIVIFEKNKFTFEKNKIIVSDVLLAKELLKFSASELRTIASIALPTIRTKSTIRTNKIILFQRIPSLTTEQRIQILKKLTCFTTHELYDVPITYFVDFLFQSLKSKRDCYQVYFRTYQACRLCHEDMTVNDKNKIFYMVFCLADDKQVIDTVDAIHTYQHNLFLPRMKGSNKATIITSPGCEINNIRAFSETVFKYRQALLQICHQQEENYATLVAHFNNAQHIEKFLHGHNLYAPDFVTPDMSFNAQWQILEQTHTVDKDQTDVIIKAKENPMNANLFAAHNQDDFSQIILALYNLSIKQIKAIETPWFNQFVESIDPKHKALIIQSFGVCRFHDKEETTPNKRLTPQQITCLLKGLEKYEETLFCPDMKGRHKFEIIENLIESFFESEENFVYLKIFAPNFDDYIKPIIKIITKEKEYLEKVHIDQRTQFIIHLIQLRFSPKKKWYEIINFLHDSVNPPEEHLE